jgi:hypothetical protein
MRGTEYERCRTGEQQKDKKVMRKYGDVKVRGDVKV